MDLRLFLAVIKRFKKVAIGGVLLAIVLAGLAYVSHGPVTWQAQSEVLLSEGSNPFIKSNPPGAGGGDASFLSSLSNVYASLVNGDAMQKAVQRATHVAGLVQASEVVDPLTGNPEPFVTLTASALSAQGASKLAAGIIPVLQNYISSQQQQAQLPASQRIQLVSVKQGITPEMAGKSAMTTPMLVFAGIIGAVLVLIFTLENSNPRTAAALGLGGRDALRRHDGIATPHNGHPELVPSPSPTARLIDASEVNGKSGRRHAGGTEHTDTTGAPSKRDTSSLQERLLRSRP